MLHRQLTAHVSADVDNVQSSGRQLTWSICQHSVTASILASPLRLSFFKSRFLFFLLHNYTFTLALLLVALSFSNSLSECALISGLLIR